MKIRLTTGRGAEREERSEESEMLHVGAAEEGNTMMGFFSM